MTLPLTPRPDRPLEPTAAAETTSTQLFGVLYITLTGLVDSVVPNSRPWSLLGRSVSYIIKLAPILWWALPAGLAAPHPELPNASTYDWLPDTVVLSPPNSVLPIPEVLPRHTSWLVLGMLLIGLNAYLLQLSPARSLWSPIQATIPVLHWMASW
ncbi:hypothetical protein DSO57_1035453 [Entomophthora muscae]|uniref:Uncharacterized protein n=1 Tax=Entomophthora muscae TaxID=34485 RepID=A0ACC2RQQ2_9FUNG|nr:hypothetical protein DSO57_1035453 [Entomophthora muscae]